ncbi:MAG: CBS domain-containing protein [Planctomycetota bacterium]|jgi:CBS domain-containing protein
MSTVEDVMMIKGPDVIVAAPTSTVSEAARLMADAEVGSLIVKDGGEVVGIFTERDLLCRVVAREQDPARVTLADVMSSPVASCRLGDEMRDVADMLAQRHIRHLAVIEGGALVGVIGVRDILAVELRETEEQIRSLQECVRQNG